MAFAYDNIKDMENIVKATGLSEDELANLIIAKENEGWTNAEIAEMLASNFDNKEYAGKAQNELDELYPSTIDRLMSWFAANSDADKQRRATERAAIVNSVNDWRDSHPEQWRVGMVNALFGDNMLLSQYYAAENAAKESEKNRESQREYNEYLKEYDRANAQKEQDAAYQKELKDAEVEMATLNRDLVNANAPEAAVILKRQEALITKYPELKRFDTKTAQDAYEAERAYAANLNRFKGQVKRNFLNDDEIQNEIERVQAASWVRPDDMSKIVDNLQAQKSTAQLAREARQSAIAGHSGKKTTESLDDSDLTKKAEDAVKNNTSPAKLSKEVKSKLFELNYSYSSGKWALKEGAK